ncbi:MAG: hypothetical protein ABL984_02545 [Pyrinomonadaceae bacterium]
METQILEINLSELKPIRCKRRLKGTWQSLDALADQCNPLALAVADVVFDWNGGGGASAGYELMGKNFVEIDLQILIDGNAFDAKAWSLNGRGIMFACMDCGTKKKFAGARYLVHTTHSMATDALSKFLIDNLYFR